MSASVRLAVVIGALMLLPVHASGQSPDETAAAWQSLRERAHEAELAGRFADQERLWKKALPLAERLGERDIRVPITLIQLGWVRWQLGRAAEAESDLVRAEALLRRPGGNRAWLAEAVSSLGSLRAARGDIAGALRLVREGLEIRGVEYGPDSEMVVESLSQLGSVCCDAWKLEEAVAAYRRALEITENTRGPDHPEVGVNATNLALALTYLERFEEAEALNLKALSISETQHGASHPDVAESLGHLGFLYEEWDRADEAESHYRRSLEIHRRGSATAPVLATALRRLGRVLMSQGRLEEAGPLLLESLKVAASRLGPRHVEVAATSIDLGELRSLRRDYSGALRFHRLAESILAERLGTGHWRTVVSRNRVARSTLQAGLPKVAESLARDLIRQTGETFGPESVQCGGAHTLLGDTLTMQGRLKEAVEPVRKGLALQEKARGGDALRMGTLHNNIGVLYRDLRRYAEAEPHFRRSLEIVVLHLGKGHPRTAFPLNSLARIRQARGDLEDAERLCREALAIRISGLGEEHLFVGFSLTTLAEILLDRGKREEAERAARHSLEIKQKNLGPDHRWIADTYSILGATLLDEEEGLALLRRALRNQEATYGTESPRLLKTLERTRTALSRLGLTERAEKISRRIATIADPPK